MESLVDKCNSGLFVATHHPMMYNKMLCKIDSPKEMGDRSPPSVTPSLDCSPRVTPSCVNSTPSVTPSFTYAISVTPTLTCSSSVTSPTALTRSPSLTPTLTTSPGMTPHLSTSSPSVTSSSSSSTSSFTCDSPQKHLLPALAMAHDDALKESVNYGIPGPANTKVPNANVCQANMNQMCKVCGEPAAGFHFGAFTCEGCKSFFGRTYNNLSSLNECKNNGRCVINKKTRTSCKSCRLRKCLMVGMSKSGSRYGRRSNWFKIHYLMQNNNTSTASATSGDMIMTDSHTTTTTSASMVTDTHPPRGLMSPSETMKTSSPDFKDFKISTESKFNPDYKFSPEFKSNTDCKVYHSPTTSSSESHNSDSSLDLSEKSLFPPFPEQLYSKDLLSLYNLPTLTPRLPPYVSPNSLAQRYLYPYYPSLLSVYSQRQYLDTLLQEAKQSEDITTVDENDDDDDHHDRTSPDCDIPPPPKFRKSSSRSPPSRNTPEWNSATTQALIRGILPFHQKLPIRDIVSGHSSDHNPGHDLFPQEEPDDLLPVGATAPQDLPIDLSMKSKFSAYPLHKIIDLEKSMCRTPAGILLEEEETGGDSDDKDDDREGSQIKTEQDAPLDLSYIGS